MKRVLLVIMAFVMCLGCVSCAGEAVNTTEPTTDPIADPVTDPITDTPTTEAPKTDAPATEAPKTDAPATEPPATEPPATEPPATEPPATEPPATEPPATEPPATEPPATEPPATEPPVTEPVVEPEDEKLNEFAKIEPADGKTVRIACIGDSITYGATLTNPTAQSYPTQLQKLLGSGYKVGNFGKSGSYVLPAENKYNVKDAALYYRNTAEYKSSLKFNADVVIIMLGTNDIRSFSCEQAKQDFMANLKSIAEEYAALPTVKKVYIASSIFISNADVIRQLSDGELASLQEQVANELGYTYINMYAMTKEYMDVHHHYDKDHVHPNAEGHIQLSNAFYSALTGEELNIKSYPVSDTGVVYVKDSGNDNANGKTAQTALKSFAKAVGLLRKNGGTIVVCGPSTTTYTLHLPENAAPITVTSVYDGVDYRASAGAKLIMAHNIAMYGDYVYDGIEICAGVNAAILACNFNNVTFGSDIKCTKTTSSFSDILIVVGANVGIGGSPDDEISLHGDCSVTINGGTWSYIRTGNRRAQPSYAHGAIAEDGKLTVTINGGVFTSSSGTNLCAATGMNNTYGECIMVINGGEFRGNVYAVGRSGTNNTGKDCVMSGKVTVEINGGTFKGQIFATQDDTVKVTGEVNVICAAQYESKLQGSFSNKTIK